MIDRDDISRPLLALAGISGAAGVALAARGSHAAEADLAIAANFLLMHAPVLLGLSLLKANRVSQVAGYVLVLGLILFAGDLAMRGETGTSLFPLAAPLGGGGLILGWLLVIASAFFGWRRAG
jgi:uncharacterized membrane protein YgdD (TMEM256/DUF423 family)